MLSTGTKAPDFTLQDQNGKKVSLHDFKGRKVVLYFYAEDGTKGCTAQAVGFAGLHAEFVKKGAVVVGISKDAVSSHKLFAEAHDLPFTILADPEKAVIQEYGVWGEKNLYGKPVTRLIRTTYIIDENGVVEKVFPNVRAGRNPEKMLREI